MIPQEDPYGGHALSDVLSLADQGLMTWASVSALVRLTWQGEAAASVINPWNGTWSPLVLFSYSQGTSSGVSYCLVERWWAAGRKAVSFGRTQHGREDEKQ